jgi:hypothetical protein
MLSLVLILKPSLAVWSYAQNFFFFKKKVRYLKFAFYETGGSNMNVARHPTLVYP